MDSLPELFCLMDDFCQEFEPALEQQLLEHGQRQRRRSSGLCLSELMTLAVLFHQLRYRQFKAFYLHHGCAHLRQEFPHLPSYQRCVALLPRCALPAAKPLPAGFWDSSCMSSSIMSANCSTSN